MAAISDPIRHDPISVEESTAWGGDRTVDMEVPHARKPLRIERIAAPWADEPPTPTAMHYTIAAVDIVGFGNRSRTGSNQVRVRRGLYAALRHSFDTAGIPWDRCVREDRGDGAMILAPADVPKAHFADHLPQNLANALVAHNRRHPDEEQIHLRLALHAGEIFHDEHGFCSTSLNLTFRMLEAEEFKSTFAESSGVLAVISSGWFYDEVIWHSELSQAGSYAGVEVTNKETTTRAWIRVVDGRRLSAVRWPRRPRR
jgi:hypothetical protein